MGPRDGTPLFCFHGDPGSRLDWDHPLNRPVVDGSGMRLIGIDGPGFGMPIRMVTAIRLARMAPSLSRWYVARTSPEQFSRVFERNLPSVDRALMREAGLDQLLGDAFSEATRNGPHGMVEDWRLMGAPSGLDYTRGSVSDPALARRIWRLRPGSPREVCGVASSQGPFGCATQRWASAHTGPVARRPECSPGS